MKKLVFMLLLFSLFLIIEDRQVFANGESFTVDVDSSVEYSNQGDLTETIMVDGVHDYAVYDANGNYVAMGELESIGNHTVEPGYHIVITNRNQQTLGISGFAEVAPPIPTTESALQHYSLQPGNSISINASANTVYVPGDFEYDRVTFYKYGEGYGVEDSGIGQSFTTNGSDIVITNSSNDTYDVYGPSRLAVFTTSLTPALNRISLVSGKSVTFQIDGEELRVKINGEQMDYAIYNSEYLTDFGRIMTSSTAVQSYYTSETNEISTNLSGEYLLTNSGSGLLELFGKASIFSPVSTTESAIETYELQPDHSVSINASADRVIIQGDFEFNRIGTGGNSYGFDYGIVDQNHYGAGIEEGSAGHIFYLFGETIISNKGSSSFEILAPARLVQFEASSIPALTRIYLQPGDNISVVPGQIRFVTNGQQFDYVIYEPNAFHNYDYGRIVSDEYSYHYNPDTKEFISYETGEHIISNSSEDILELIGSSVRFHAVSTSEPAFHIITNPNSSHTTEIYSIENHMVQFAALNACSFEYIDYLEVIGPEKRISSSIVTEQLDEGEVHYFPGSNTNTMVIGESDCTFYGPYRSFVPIPSTNPLTYKVEIPPYQTKEVLYKDQMFWGEFTNDVFITEQYNNENNEYHADLSYSQSLGTNPYSMNSILIYNPHSEPVSIELPYYGVISIYNSSEELYTSRVLLPGGHLYFENTTGIQTNLLLGEGNYRITIGEGIGSKVENDVVGVGEWSSSNVSIGQTILIENIGQQTAEVRGVSDVVDFKSINTGGWDLERIEQQDPNQTSPESYVADPINTATGAHEINLNPITLHGATDSPFQMHYNSLLLEGGPLGKGWGHNHQASLETANHDELVLHWSSNRTNRFTLNDSGVYTSEQKSAQYDQITYEDNLFTLIRKDQTKYIFDSSGLLIEWRNRHGQSIVYSYTSGLLTTIEDVIGGHRLFIEYDRNGEISTVADEMDHEVQFTYDTKHHLVQIGYPDGKSMTYTYDTQGKVVSGTNGENVTLFTNEYDEHSRVAIQYDALGNATEFEYLINGTTIVTDREGHASTYFYDDDYHLMKLEDSLGVATLYTYDEQGNKTSVTDPLGNVTSYEYDEYGNVLRTTDADGRSTIMAYDEFNNLLSVTNAVYGQITYGYDLNNRLIVSSDPLGNESTVTYDVYGLMSSITSEDGDIVLFSYTNSKLTSQTDAEGNISSHSYDESGRLLSTTDSEGNTTAYTYDERDRITSITDPLGHSTTFTYNSQGDMLSQTDALGNITQYQYNGNGKLIKTTNAMNHETLYDYDKEDRLIRITDLLGHETSYVYDAKGRLTKIFDPRGNEISYVYDAANRVISMTDAEGNVTSYEYDPLGNVVKSVDPLGYETMNEYDPLGRLLTVTDPLDRLTQYTYDSKGQVLLAVDASGFVTIFSYDDAGNVLTQTDARGNTTHFDYNGNNQLVIETNELNEETQYEYDGNGNLLLFTDAAGEETEFVYDAKGRQVEATDANGNRTSIQYDALDRVIGETNAEGYTRTYEYDALGRIVEEVDEAGKITASTYDALGRLLSVTDPLNHTVQYTYDANGNLITFTDAKGYVTEHAYNKNNQLVSTADAFDHSTTYEYDVKGRLIKTTDARGYSLTYEYDGMDKLNQSSDALGNTYTMEYNAEGNLIKFMDALGNTAEETTYDAVHMPIEVTDALGNRTQYAYDALLRLQTETDALARSKTYGYDVLSRLASVLDEKQGLSIQQYDPSSRLIGYTDPNMNQTQYVYDKVGNIISIQNAGGMTTSYNYDARGLLLQSVNGRAQQANFEYDDNSRLHKQVDLVGTIQYTYDANDNITEVTETTSGLILREYDAMDRVVEYTDEQGNTIKYEYNELGDLIKLTYPDGKQVHYSYNGNRQMIEVIDWNNRFTTYDYDANGKLTTTNRPDGSVETRTYDAAGRLLSLIDVTATGTILNEYHYDYDEVGNVVEEENEFYAYDELDRLIFADDTHYSYDLAGNITSITVTGDTYGTGVTEAVYMTYTSDNRLATYNGLSIEYDGDYNMTYGPLHGDMQHFVYDSRNRLVQAGNLFYEYNAENIRTRLTEQTVTGSVYTNYIVNPHAELSQLLMETDESGTLKTYYIYGLGLIGREDAGSDYSVYHFDRRGSTSVLTDVYGQVTDRYEYGAFGELILHDGSTDQPFLYNGRDGVMTDQNGLIYMRSRYYNPDIKRFMNRDVVNGTIVEGQSLNRYAYVNGNPISYVDPFGLSRDGDGETFLKSTLDFLVLDDIESLFSRDATFGERLLAATTFIPGGKFVNIAGKGIKSAVKVKKVSDKLEDLPRPHTENNVFRDKGTGELSRNGALNQAKRDAGIPRSQQPEVVNRVDMRSAQHEGGHVIKDSNGKVISTREYVYTNKDGKKIVIQDHSAGHQKGGQGPHFNVRPADNTRTGKVPGTMEHYPFNK